MVPAPIRYLDLAEALHICERLAIGPVRDIGLLGSAIERPRTSLYGADAYPDFATKAAALTESLVSNHALFDGNKRLGFACLVLFLDRNGTWLDIDDDEAYTVIMRLAGGHIDLDGLADTIRAWCAAS